MKKISLFILLFMTFVTPSYALTVSPNALNAQELNSGSPSAVKQTIKTAAAENIIVSLKQRAKTEITRRITFLNELSGKITDIKKISDADKTTLKTQIQQQIDGLTTLLSKIDADTDITTLRADVKSITNGYYIFAFFRVKISLLVASERLFVTAGNMNLIYNKLVARVADQKKQGKVVTSLETLLTGMQAKIADANIQYQAAQTELSSLTAQGYPGNKTTLTDARSKLKVGSGDLRVAFQDATKVRQGLGDIGGNLKLKSGTDSASNSVLPVGQK
jgi:hypothetical protein